MDRLLQEAKAAEKSTSRKVAGEKSVAMHGNYFQPEHVGKEAAKMEEEIKKLKATATQQQHEIMRLLQTVKKLSDENTNLVQDRNLRTKMEQENAVLKQSMEQFKQEYKKKVRFFIIAMSCEE